MRRLSKSTYLKGRQCPLRAWYAMQGEPEPAIDPDEVWEEREAEGAAVEEQAATLFPTGVRIVLADDDPEVEERRSEVEAFIAASRNRLANSLPLFQVHFATEDLLAIVDIAEPRGGGWYLWEVKASTSIKPIFTYDLAFQAEVARRSGVKVVGVGVIHLNSEYVRGDALDASQLLVQVDLTTTVNQVATAVGADVQQLLTTVRSPAAPEAIPSNHCDGNLNAKSADRPSTCGHLDRSGKCGGTLPEHWVWDLPRVTGQKVSYIRSLPDQSIGALGMDDADWTLDQLRVIAAVHQNRVQLQAGALAAKLEDLEWPIAYMDFEFDPGMAVPRFPGTKPYARVPFQWSVHVQSHPGAPLAEHAFLHEALDDPRRPFFNSLIATLPESGSIVVHSRNAEVTVLNQLGEALGASAQHAVDSLKARIFDTVDLMRAGYYNPSQHGSYSLKKVAPAILGRGYEDLGIQSGMAAVVSWKRLIAPSTAAEDRLRLKDDLLRYCGRDTLLMHDMIEGIRDLVKYGHSNPGTMD